MSSNTPYSESTPWTLTAEELAQQLGVCKRHIAGMNSSGKLPAPVRFGRSVRWVADDIRDWLKAGAPSRDRWEVLRQGGRR